jgi:hypothetical protein
MTAIEMIAAEHERITAPGFFDESNEKLISKCEFAWLACAFAIPDEERHIFLSASRLCEEIAPIKNKKSRIQQLVAAGALVAAEIERLLAEEKTGDGKYHRDSPMPALFPRGTKILIEEPQDDADDGIAQDSICEH